MNRASSGTRQNAIAFSSVLFPDPLLPVKTVQPANSPPPLSRSNSRDLKPRIFFKEILLMYTDGLFYTKKLLDGIVHEPLGLLEAGCQQKPYTPSTARCAAKISFSPTSAKSMRPLSCALENEPFSAVAWVSISPPSAVITTFMSTSACESSS